MADPGTPGVFCLFRAGQGCLPVHATFRAKDSLRPDDAHLKRGCDPMMKVKVTAVAMGLMGLVAIAPEEASAQALRFDAGVAAGSTTTLGATAVQYRRHYRASRHDGRKRSHRGSSIGAGIAGLAAGAIIGGIIANSQRQTYYEMRPDTMDEAISYCLRRFRSYDIRSGTYLGYDGMRHACP